MTRCALTLCCTLAFAAPAAAAPLVLYDPGTTTPPAGSELKSVTALQAPPVATCGLTAPCTDLNTAANASLVAPLGSSFEYGMSGVASGTVSNHGQGGELGVLGWMKAGDTTLYVGLSVGASRFNGKYYSVLPAGARP